MFFVCFIKFSFSVWFMGLEIKHETLSVVLVFKQSRWSVCCVLKSVPAYSEQSRSLCSGTFYWSATAHWENAAIIIKIWNSPKWRFKSLFSIWSFFPSLFEFDPLYLCDEHTACWSRWMFSSTSVLAQCRASDSDLRGFIWAVNACWAIWIIYCNEANSQK